ncbi:helix-turn-helix domain-containing protein [Streptomyces sp. NPDC051561]|uniref:helix-turn-helix domain-containing protein n=1 Tax=Streptomyces sp. NPDC051561 TaxID=3365658 RepID=UPI0037B2E744
MTEAAAHTPQTFAKWLKDRLLKLGYPERGGQNAFAKASGISTATVSRLLRADGVPELRTLEQLAQGLGVSHGEILVRAGVSTPEKLAGGIDRPISPQPITAKQAAAELGITDPQAIAAFETMVDALRVPREDGRSASG